MPVLLPKVRKAYGRKNRGWVRTDKGEKVMKYLGVYATKEEIQLLKDTAKQPYIMVGNSLPETPQEVCHSIALSHGLPGITGYYGCDLRTGEFVSM